MGEIAAYPTPEIDFTNERLNGNGIKKETERLTTIITTHSNKNFINFFNDMQPVD
jgi:hypothetical protein